MFKNKKEGVNVYEVVGITKSERLKEVVPKEEKKLEITPPKEVIPDIQPVQEIITAAEIEETEPISDNTDSINTPNVPKVSFADYPIAYLNEEQTEFFKNDIEINANYVKFDKIYNGLYTVMDSDNQICALAIIDQNHLLSITQRLDL
jgi:hypothetical protein